MTAINSIKPPFAFFPNANGGGLEAGFVYIGNPGVEARTSPKASFFDKALTIPSGTASGAAIRTSRGQLVTAVGSPVSLYVDGDYSITVLNSTGGLVYSATTQNFAIDQGEVFGSRAEAIASVTSADLITVLHNGQALHYRRDATGTALTTSGGAVKWSPAEDATPQHWGAVTTPNEVWDANLYPALTLKGGYAGTDAKAQINACFAWCSANNRAVHMPAGAYLIRRETPAVWDFTGILIAPQAGLHIVADPGAKLVVDFDPNEDYDLCDLFRNGVHSEAPTSRTVNKRVRFENLTFVSMWDYYPSGGGDDGRVHMMCFSGCERVELIECTAYGINGKFSRSRGCNSVSVIGGDYQRIASDCMRFLNTNNVTISGVTFRNTDDDVIALASANTVEGDIRSNIAVTNCTFEDCESVMMLGARNAVFSGNVFRRCKAGLQIGGRGADQEGDIAALNIVVSDNTVFDPITRFDNTTGLMQVASATKAAMVVAGNVSSGVTTGGVAPGKYRASNQTIVPFVGLDSGGRFIAYNEDAETRTISEGGGIIMSNNTVKRTLPAVATYSLWGQGLMFNNTGFKDPAVADINFTTHAFGLQGEMNGALVEGNIADGFMLGAGFFLNLPDPSPRELAFKNIIFSNNTAIRCRFGVSHQFVAANPSPPYTWGLFFTDNVFDCDPEMISPDRITPINGSWNTGAGVTTAPTAYMLRNITGTTIRGGRVANCWQPVLTGGTMSDRVNIEGLTVLCDPVSPTANANNKGVCQPGFGSEFKHLIVDSTPTSANYGLIKNHCVDVAATVPTVGTYVTGHFVRVQSPVTASSKTLLGWLRQSTGTGHTVATTVTADWAPLFATTS